MPARAWPKEVWFARTPEYISYSSKHTLQFLWYFLQQQAHPAIPLVLVFLPIRCGATKRPQESCLQFILVLLFSAKV